MKAAFITGPEAIVVREVPDPVPGPDDVVVKIKACGLCGSDKTWYTNGGWAGFEVGESGLPFGHEPSGVVASVGTNITDFAVGDRVFVNPNANPARPIGGGELGALADLLLIENCRPEHSLYKLGADIPFEVAALNEPMGIALHAVNRGTPKSTDKVAVIGAGPIGLGAMMWLKLRGVEHVVVCDIDPDRLDLALRMGADAVIDTREELMPALAELHGSAGNAAERPRAGTDLYIDFSGSQAAFDAIVGSAKHRAVVVSVGLYKAPITVDMWTPLQAELDLRWSMGFPDELQDVRDQLASHWEKFAPLVTHRIPFSDLQGAIDILNDPDSGAIKVSVVFD